MLFLGVSLNDIIISGSVFFHQVGDGYRWYDILEWKLKDSQYIWFAPGWFAGSGPSSAHQGVFLDCLELSRSEVLNVPAGGIVIESTH